MWKVYLRRGRKGRQTHAVVVMGNRYISGDIKAWHDKPRSGRVYMVASKEKPRSGRVYMVASQRIRRHIGNKR